MMHHPGGYDPNVSMGRAVYFGQSGHQDEGRRIQQPPQLKILERRAPDAWHQPVGVGVMGGRAGHYDNRFMPTLRQVGHSLANSASPMEVAQQNENENKYLNATPTPTFPDEATQHGRKRRASSELVHEKRGRGDGNLEAPGADSSGQGFGHQLQPGPAPSPFNAGQVQANQPSPSGAARREASPIEMLERLVALDEGPGQAQPPPHPVQHLQWGNQPNGQQAQPQGAAGDGPPLFQANYPQPHAYENPMYGQQPIPGYNPYLNMVGQYIGPAGAQVGPHLWQPFLFHPNQPHPMQFDPIHGQMFANQGQANPPQDSIHGWCDLWETSFVDSSWWAR